MGKYIDADRLIRSVESIGLVPQKHADYNDGRNDVIMMVLDLIDSLQQEQPEVDLEEEINIYLRTFSSSFENGIEYTKNIARHFYELGKLNNARKEENK